MFVLKNSKDISKAEIDLAISSLLFQIIENKKPYTWYKTEELFINSYNGRLSYDYSGEVREMTCADLIKIENELGKSEVARFIHKSKLDELLS